jgi:Na+-driven multidrug efflux pump
MKTTAREHLSIAGAYQFFVPLILMTELNMISKSAIHAYLARSDAPGPTLAAFNTVFTFYYAITSASEVTAPLALAWLRGRGDLGYIYRFMMLLMGLPCALVGLTAFTSVGDWFYGDVFGLGERATADARVCAGILLLSAPVLIARGLAFSLLMRARLTLLISGATMVRLASLALSLLLWPTVLDGAAIGAAALVTCMTVETAFAWMFAWREYRALKPRPVHSTRPALRSMWRFSWPLALNQSAELGVVFVINIFLGRLVGAELALAAFGVVHGLTGLLLGPLRNLAHTAQTLVARREDVTLLFGFTTQLAVMAFVGALVLFNSPLNHWVLSTVMGLGPELTAACLPALSVAAGACLFWAFAALFRGLLSNARTTGALAVTGALRVGVATVVGGIGITAFGASGALVGMLAWIASYIVEMLVAGYRLRRLGWYVSR